MSTWPPRFLTCQASSSIQPVNWRVRLDAHCFVARLLSWTMHTYAKRRGSLVSEIDGLSAVRKNDTRAYLLVERLREALGRAELFLRRRGTPDEGVILGDQRGSYPAMH
jgi:hypothetical protein